MDRIQLGMKLKEYREEVCMTQEELARVLGMDPKKISRIECGKQFPEEKYLIHLTSISSLEIKPVQTSILEIKNTENKSRFEKKPSSVSNTELLNQIQKLQESHDKIQESNRLILNAISRLIPPPSQ